MIIQTSAPRGPIPDPRLPPEPSDPIPAPDPTPPGPIDPEPYPRYEDVPPTDPVDGEPVRVANGADEDEIDDFGYTEPPSSHRRSGELS